MSSVLMYCLLISIFQESLESKSAKEVYGLSLVCSKGITQCGILPVECPLI